MNEEIYDTLLEAKRVLNSNCLYRMGTDNFHNVLVAKDFIKIALGKHKIIGFVSLAKVIEQLKAQNEWPVETEPTQDRFDFPNGVKMTFVHYSLPDWEFPNQDTRYTACFIALRNVALRGIAKCNPRDTYDQYTGEKLALRRALKEICGPINPKGASNSDIRALEKIINDKDFRQLVWAEVFKAHGRNKYGQE